MKRPITRPDEAAANVRRFARELDRNPRLQERLGHVHAWYALRLDKGNWAFGPSKFVGYPGNTAQEYLRTASGGADGGATENVLARWFPPVDPTTRLGRELSSALSAFLARWNRVPRKDSRISVVSGEISGRVNADREVSARIRSDPDICGGRPCIKGTRVRVSDVMDLLAQGVSQHEILADYPYLAPEDIAAALAYAARATGHRVIKAA